MKPKKVINVRLKNPKEKIAFLERMEDIEGIDFSVSSRDNLLRINIYGTKEQILEFITLTKRIHEELEGEEYAIEDIERE